MRLERNLNDGQVTTNWHQIEQNLGSINRMLIKSGLDVLQSLYVFTRTNLLLTGHRAGIVLVARHEPSKEDGRWGRYVIYLSPENEIEFDWIEEKTFQEMLKYSHVNLPDPNPEEASAAREAVRRALAEE